MAEVDAEKEHPEEEGELAEAVATAPIGECSAAMAVDGQKAFCQARGRPCGAGGGGGGGGEGHELDIWLQLPSGAVLPVRTAAATTVAILKGWILFLKKSP